MSEYTISVSGDRVARAHDLRTPERVFKGQAREKPIFKNINASRTKDNVVLVGCDDARKKFNEIFSTVVEEYNAKQKRKDRHITDYYQQCLDNKKMGDVIKEYVISVGNKDNHPDGREAVEILTDAFEQFKRDNPNLPVMWAVIHMDESTPHMHIAFASMSKGRKNGLSMKAGFDAAYREMGFKVTRSRPEPSKVQWQAKQMESLEKVLVSHGHRRKVVDGEKRPHERVDIFKQNEKLRQEKAQLEADIERLENEVKPSLEERLRERVEQLSHNRLASANDDLRRENADLGKKLEDMRVELQELMPVLEKAQDVKNEQKERELELDVREAEQNRREDQYQDYVEREVRWEREDYRAAARDYEEKVERITGHERFAHVVSEVINTLYGMVPVEFQAWLSLVDENEIVECVRQNVLVPSLSQAQKRSRTYADNGAPELWTKQTPADNWDYEPGS